MMSYGKILQVRIEDELMEALEALALSRHLTVSDIARIAAWYITTAEGTMAIFEWLGRGEDKDDG